MKNYYLISLVFLIASSSHAQGTVEAEFDTIYNYQFNSLNGTHNKRILIDQSHNTIYSLPYGKQTAREMLRIMEEDGFNVEFTNLRLDSTNLNLFQPDLLIIHGMPNNRIAMGKNEVKEIIYKSPLIDNEVIDITRYVHKGGSLFLFLS
ncbi:MAG: hypothetical protein MRY83_09880, partial [Flavobacteriales bacterium]|nr:hypothetical protein [Flavobacteriales bacterium]